MKTSKQSFSARQTSAVLAILVVVAGIGYGLYAGFTAILRQKHMEETIPKVLEALKHQRNDLVKVIETYHGQLGYYPPFHSSGAANRGVMNPLLYELLGTRFRKDQGVCYIPIDKEPIRMEAVQKHFNTLSFSNTLPFPSWPTNFLESSPLARVELAEGTDMLGLGFPSDSVVSEDLLDDFQFTSWRYTADPAEHNPGKFDLWIEFNVKGKHYVVGNWEEK